MSERYVRRLELLALAKTALGGPGGVLVAPTGATVTFRKLFPLVIIIGGASLTARFAPKRISDAFDSSNRHRERDVSELWHGLKHSSEIRWLFASAVGCFMVAAGIPTFFVLNYFFRWLTPS